MTDTERTEAEIVKEMKRWPGYTDFYLVRPIEGRIRGYAVLGMQPSGKAWDILVTADSLNALLVGVKESLPIPAETEHQCSDKCVDELQELCDSESHRANVNATTIHDLRLTLRELAGIAERISDFADHKKGCGYNQARRCDCGFRSLQKCNVQFRASHPELFNTGNAGEGEQTDGN
jgi:hypothetical protein